MAAAMSPRPYGRRATPSRQRIRNHDGVVHIVCEDGAIVACGLRVSATPWRETRDMINGPYLSADAIATCVVCLAYARPPKRRP